MVVGGQKGGRFFIRGGGGVDYLRGGGFPILERFLGDGRFFLFVLIGFSAEVLGPEFLLREEFFFYWERGIIPGDSVLPEEAFFRGQYFLASFSSAGASGRGPFQRVSPACGVFPIGLH